MSASAIRSADSRLARGYASVPETIDLVITSPPYYGMRTYVADQWLRNWFLGGLPEVPYGEKNPLSHQSPEAFAESLAQVWDRVGERLSAKGRMFVRFGAIPSRKARPREIMLASLEHSRFSWKEEMLASQRDIQRVLRERFSERLDRNDASQALASVALLFGTGGDKRIWPDPVTRRNRYGTLAMPAFPIDQNPDKVFFVDRAPAYTGMLCEIFRRNPEVKRSIHLNSSVCAVGPGADFLLKDHHHTDLPWGARPPALPEE